MLLMNGAAKGGVVKASYNLKDGKLWIQHEDEGDQLVYRISEDEWWKIHYEGKIVSRPSSPPCVLFDNSERTFSHLLHSFIR